MEKRRLSILRPGPRRPFSFSRISPLRNWSWCIQTELDTAKADLTAAQTTIAEQTTELAKSNQVKIAYKFLLDVNAARAALEKLDTNTALQAINFAKVDLADLLTTNIDAAATTGFADRLDEAAKNITEPDLLKSRDALDTLYSSLLLLVNNLK